MVLPMEEKAESVLESIYEGGEEGEILDGGLEDDVDMMDSETLDGCDLQELSLNDKSARGGGEGGEGKITDYLSPGASIRGQKTKRKKRRRNRKNKKGSADLKITDINKFVIDTCRHLKERKSYLVWNAVGCLGVSGVSNLVKEVDAIQGCGGQKTADGKRFRSSGGILWNILKTREPKAYKEIMAKGREFEKQFRPRKTRRVNGGDEEEEEEAISPRSSCATDGPGERALDAHSSPPKGERKSALNRIRLPVAYDDLFEEGQVV